MGTTDTDIESLQRTFVNGLASDDGFTRHGNRLATWDVSKGCNQPVAVTKWSRSTGLVKNLTRSGRIPVIEITFLTPCRRCKPCLERTARLWRYRATNELQGAHRSWMGTFTLSPSKHFWVDSLCAGHVPNFWNLPQGKKFAHQASVIGKEATKFLKRVRKNSGFRFRYLLVTEAHDSEDTAPEMKGRPHLHMLLHEFADQPIRKRMLEGQWPHGHSGFKLVDDDKAAAFYVTSYISKAMDARVRASLNYGY